MKKTVATLSLLLALLLCLAGCGAAPVETEAPTEAPVVTEAPTEVGAPQ